MATKYIFTGRKLTGEERKNRMAIPRNPASEQNAAKRARTFDEVSDGFTESAAIAEAKRCLLCPTAPCVNGCPVGVRIPELLEAVAEGDFKRGLEILQKDNALPAVTGRVCPQEVQCEGCCTLEKSGRRAVAIGYIERFLADWGRRQPRAACSSTTHSLPSNNNSPKRVAIVGSGPAGLTAAADLARLGHEVHVFEAFHRAGGVLTYGIPSFRLPKDIVESEVGTLEHLGIVFHTSAVVGTLFSLDDLLQLHGFAAIFVGIGAGLPKFMGIPGEDLNGICSANEYLTRVNLMRSNRFPETDTPVHAGKKVAVVGGGNVAMDAVRTALRLGAERAMLIYRRSREEMPARAEEIHHAEEEGVEFHFLCNPVRWIGDSQGWLSGVECVRMELGPADASGRRSPRPQAGSEFIVDLDTAIIAVGTGANPLLTRATPDLRTNRWGYVEVDDQFRTSKRGVFAGGDIARGAATVILAMGDGRRAAASIQEFLVSGSWPAEHTPISF